MDVVALGELLVDFTSAGISGQGNKIYEANPGGAPCNVLAMLQKLGRNTAFIGKVGKDSFGEMLVSVVKEQGISAEGICYDEKIPTTLAFVHNAADGERTFSFYRNPGADMMLRKEEVEEALLKETKLFHFGSLSMTSSDAEEATKYAIWTAKQNGAIISFDPNLRPALWNHLDEAKEKIAFGMSQCDVLKISDNEITFMTGETDIDRGVQKLIEEYQIPFVCATMGNQGSKAFFGNEIVEAEAFLMEDTIDTTGAGDTFCACLLDYILRYGIQKQDKERVREMLQFANAAAALITTKKGALRVMPEREEIEKVLGGKSCSSF